VTRPVRTSRRRWWRRRAAALLAAVAGGLLSAATPAGAAPAPSGPGFYAVSGPTAGTFQVLHTGNLMHSTLDDAVFGLSTSARGAMRLPFPIQAWNQTFRNVVVSTNGTVQLGLTAAQGTPVFENDCLPSPSFGNPAVLPYWDDLIFFPGTTVAGAPDGVFVRTAGLAPHRTFLVSWQGQENLSTPTPVLAQVLFREGSQTITFRYGTTGGGSATIGIQARQQLQARELSCNSGALAVAAGTQITLVHTNAL
jgi:hypothetical protein